MDMKPNEFTWYTGSANGLGPEVKQEFLASLGLALALKHIRDAFAIGAYNEGKGGYAHRVRYDEASGYFIVEKDVDWNGGSRTAAIAIGMTGLEELQSSDPGPLCDLFLVRVANARRTMEQGVTYAKSMPDGYRSLS